MTKITKLPKPEKSRFAPKPCKSRVFGFWGSQKLPFLDHFWSGTDQRWPKVVKIDQNTQNPQESRVLISNVQKTSKTVKTLKKPEKKGFKKDSKTVFLGVGTPKNRFFTFFRFSPDLKKPRIFVQCFFQKKRFFRQK